MKQNSGLAHCLIACCLASLPVPAFSDSFSSLKDNQLDLSGGMETFADILKGKHHFSAEEKLFSYEHVNGPVPAAGRKAFEQAMQQHYERKDKEALVSFNKALKAAPKYLPVYIEKAAMLADVKQPDKAVSVCEQMLSIDPKYVPGLHLEACCYSEMNQPEKAIKTWGKAISVDAKDAVAYSQRAKVYNTMGKKDAARLDQDEAERLFLPQKVGLMVADGHAAEAMSQVQAAIRKYPSDFELRMCELTMLMTLNKFEDALKASSQTAKKIPETKPIMCCMQSKCHVSLSKFDEAAQDLSTAIDGFKHPPAFSGEYADIEDRMFKQLQRKVLIDRAEAYRKAKKYGKALVDATTYIQQHPKESIGFDERAAIYEDCGDKKKALSDYRQAISQNDRDRRASDGVDRLEPSTTQEKTTLRSKH